MSGEERKEKKNIQNLTLPNKKHYITLRKASKKKCTKSNLDSLYTLYLYLKLCVCTPILV